MLMACKERRGVGRKKRNVPAKTVRIDADLVTMGEAIARKEGIPIGEYLGMILRPRVERDYDQLITGASGRLQKGFKAPDRVP